MGIRCLSGPTTTLSILTRRRKPYTTWGWKILSKHQPVELGDRWTRFTSRVEQIVAPSMSRTSGQLVVHTSRSLSVLHTQGASLQFRWNKSISPQTLLIVTTTLHFCYDKERPSAKAVASGSSGSVQQCVLAEINGNRVETLADLPYGYEARCVRYKLRMLGQLCATSIALCGLSCTCSPARSNGVGQPA
jgi:hypothetical protein